MAFHDHAHDDHGGNSQASVIGLSWLDALGGFFVMMFYSGSMAFWLHLMFSRVSLDDYIHMAFIEDHCREPSQPEMIYTTTTKKYTFDKPIDEKNIPEEAKVYRSKNQLPTLRKKNVPPGTPEIPSST